MVVGVVVDNGSLMFGAKVLSISATPGSAPQRPESRSARLHPVLNCKRLGPFLRRSTVVFTKTDAKSKSERPELHLFQLLKA